MPGLRPPPRPPPPPPPRIVEDSDFSCLWANSQQGAGELTITHRQQARASCLIVLVYSIYIYIQYKPTSQTEYYFKEMNWNIGKMWVFCNYFECGNQFLSLLSGLSPIDSG